MASANEQGVTPSTVPRLIHAALVGGCVMFALVTYFIVRPRRSDTIPPHVLYAILSAAVAALTLSFTVLRRRVPLKSTNESSDLYWTRAATPALITWTVVESSVLLSIVAYMLSGSPIATGLFALALVSLISLHPGRLERA
jgi:hypothetical protein